MIVKRLVLSISVCISISILGCSKMDDAELIESIESFPCDFSSNEDKEIFILKMLITEKNKLSGGSQEQISRLEKVEKEIERRLNNLSESDRKKLIHH